jgi:hypothetical protein
MKAATEISRPRIGLFSGDRINPIVIKELRQAVQSRFVTAALMALLLIQALAIGLYLLSSGDVGENFSAGREVFMLLYAILLGIGMLFVPFYTAARLAAERSDTNVDLLFITTIKPRSIILGKMLSACVLAGLIFSACMPFLTFTYFLRGIDLQTIFSAVIFGLFVVLGCTQGALLVAALPINRPFKVILAIIALVGFIIIYVLTMTSVGRLTFDRNPFSGGRSDFWTGVVSLLSIIAFLSGLSFMLSVASIKPIAANRAMPVRMFLSVGWAVAGAAAMLSSFFQKDHTPVTIWIVFFTLLFSAAFFVAISERDEYGRRLLRSVPRNPLKRALSFPFFSGAAGGMVWAMAMTLLTMGITWVWAKSFRTYSDLSSLVDSPKRFGGLCLNVFAYALTAFLLRRYLLKRIPSEFTWLLAMILLVLGSTLPVLIGYLLFFNDDWGATDYGRWFVGNPFAWGYRGSRVFFLKVGVTWAAIVWLLSLPWLLGRFRQFRNSASANE